MRGWVLRGGARGTTALVAIAFAALASCGGAPDPCTGAQAVAAEGLEVAVLKADGSIWRWGGGSSRPSRADMRGRQANAFVDGTMCVRGADGYAWCPFLVDGPDVPDQTLNVATWIDLQFLPGGGYPEAEICAIRGDGTMTCRFTANVPFQDREQGIKGAAIGAFPVCAVRSDGTVSCNAAYTHPPADPATQYWAGPFDELTGVVQVVAADNTACARTETGDMNVWCWGWGGLPWGPQRPAPVQGIGGAAVSLMAGDRHVCALRQDGALLCWGDSSGSAVLPGFGTTTPQPIALRGPTVSIASGTNFACAVLADSSLWCWGRNDYGQLGDGTTGGGGPDPRPVTSCR